MGKEQLDEFLEELEQEADFANDDEAVNVRINPMRNITGGVVVVVVDQYGNTLSEVEFQPKMAKVLFKQFKSALRGESGDPVPNI